MNPIKRSGRYGARVHLGGGKFRWLGTFDTEGEAQEAEARARADVAEGRRLTRESWAEFAGRWTIDYNHVHPNGRVRWGEDTLKTLRYALKPFVAQFGHHPVNRFPVPEALPWASKQPESVVRAVRAMMNDARKSQLCESNPFEKLGLERSHGRAGIVALTEEELVLLADCARAACGTYGPQFAAFLTFQGQQGLRPIATAQLRPEDVQGEALYVRRPGKHVESRTVLLFAESVSALASYPRPFDAGFLFSTPTGRKLSKTNLTYWWNKVRTVFEGKLDPRRAAELRDARPRGGSIELYELRHTAATLMLRRGLSSEQVAWQLGHTDGGALVENLYGHPTDEDRFAAMKQAMAQRDRFMADATSDARWESTA